MLLQFGASSLRPQLPLHHQHVIATVYFCVQVHNKVSPSGRSVSPYGRSTRGRRKPKSAFSLEALSLRCEYMHKCLRTESKRRGKKTKEKERLVPGFETSPLARWPTEKIPRPTSRHKNLLIVFFSYLLFIYFFLHIYFQSSKGALPRRASCLNI